jgi:hypothetical protein
MAHHGALCGALSTEGEQETVMDATEAEITGWLDSDGLKADLKGLRTEVTTALAPGWQMVRLVVLAGLILMALTTTMVAPYAFFAAVMLSSVDTVFSHCREHRAPL